MMSRWLKVYATLRDAFLVLLNVWTHSHKDPPCVHFLSLLPFELELKTDPASGPSYSENLCEDGGPSVLSVLVHGRLT